ncbi:MAG: RNA polymerase sigma factor [Acidobacteriota bacterium]
MGEDESILIERAKAGDIEAATALLTRHETLVHRTCRHLLPVGEDLDGAVQEALLRVLRGLRGFSGRGSLSSWVAAIAVNLCRDRLRRRRLVPFLPLERGDEEEPSWLDVLPASDPDPERVVMARQAVTLVHREFRRLPRRQREVFALRFFAELELGGIAEALGVDVGTVKTHLHRAIRRVRTTVEEAAP